MNTNNTLTLPDGRKLAYAEYGKPEGTPVLYFHGSPSSRLEPLLFGDDLFGRSGIRLIAPDRPGMGQSDFLPKRGFAAWPKDVAALADALGLKQFSVLGMSGGGGYVAACAAKIPERLKSAVIVSGAWRMDWPEALDNLPFPNVLIWQLASKAPFLLPGMLNMMKASFKGSGEQAMAQQKKSLPAPDSALLELPGRMDAFLQMANESMQAGVKGADLDMRLYAREWDFGLDEIRMPLKLFYGELDVNVPFPLVQRVMGLLPTAQLVSYQNEAHLSTLANHFDEIAKTLL
jgi:pimeloyl-ACP methyl ester carboxylesterase